MEENIVGGKFKCYTGLELDFPMKVRVGTYFCQFLKWLFADLERCMSWFSDHMMTEMDTQQEGGPLTKLERWRSREQFKREKLRKERSELQLKLQKYLNKCDTIRLKLEGNLRELQQSECSSQVASMLLFSHVGST